MNTSECIVCFDLETTGLSITNDQIIDLCIIQLCDGVRQDPLKFRFKPQCEINAGAQAVHGISAEDLIDCPAFEKHAVEIYALMNPATHYFTGYNIRTFDVPRLTAEFARCGIAWKPWPDHILDPIQVFRANEAKPHKLVDALTHYTGRDLGTDAHDAQADTIAALDVFEAQCKRYGLTTPEEYNAVTRNPDWIDATGKFIFDEDGEPLLNFGKREGESMRDAVDYLRWMLTAKFSSDVKELCERALHGKFPTRDNPQAN